jgi:deazaflavin-dependent oxidoreductase (nitroreductase family)
VTADAATVRALSIGPNSSRAERTIDITTTGRRSGVRRTVEVWLHRVDGHWYLTGMPMPRGWYANLRAHPRFIVHLKHGVRADLRATAEPVDDAIRSHVIRSVLALQANRNLESSVTARQDFDTWMAHSPLVEVVFDDKELAFAASTHNSG